MITTFIFLQSITHYIFSFTNSRNCECQLIIDHQTVRIFQINTEFYKSILPSYPSWFVYSPSFLILTLKSPKKIRILNEHSQNQIKKVLSSSCSLFKSYPFLWNFNVSMSIGKCFHSSFNCMVFWIHSSKWASVGTERFGSTGLTAKTGGSHPRKNFYQNFLIRLSKILLF